MSDARERFRQIDSLFDAALDLEPNERDAFLDTSCGSDDELQARVRTLLDAHERSSGFLQSPAVELAAVLTGLVADATSSPASHPSRGDPSAPTGSRIAAPPRA